MEGVLGVAVEEGLVIESVACLPDRLEVGVEVDRGVGVKVLVGVRIAVTVGVGLGAGVWLDDGIIVAVGVDTVAVEELQAERETEITTV